MKLKRTVDVKNVIGLLFKFLFIYMVINLINSKYNLALSAIVIFACIIYGSIFERCIYLENSYLYIKRRNVRQKPNSLKDNHIRLSDVHSYSLNNPFLQFSDFCLSEKNITLYLNNSKSICFAAKYAKPFVQTLFSKNNELSSHSFCLQSVCYQTCFVNFIRSFVAQPLMNPFTIEELYKFPETFSQFLCT